MHLWSHDWDVICSHIKKEGLKQEEISCYSYFSACHIMNLQNIQVFKARIKVSSLSRKRCYCEWTLKMVDATEAQNRIWSLWHIPDESLKNSTPQICYWEKSRIMGSDDDKHDFQRINGLLLTQLWLCVIRNQLTCNQWRLPQCNLLMSYFWGWNFLRIHLKCTIEF